MSEDDRRRELSREYKETARPMGIFQVRNRQSGRVFLGMSVDLPAMLNRQRFQLEMGGHQNRPLQAEWNALGADAFVIDVVDVLEPSEDAAPRDVKEDLAELLGMWRTRYGTEGTQLY